MHQSSWLYERRKVTNEVAAKFHASRPSANLYHEVPEGLIETTEEDIVRLTDSMSTPNFHLYYEVRQVHVRLGDVLTPESLGQKVPPFCTYGLADGASAADMHVWLKLEMFWLTKHDGYAVARDFWPGKFRYFRFGCQHTRTETNQKRMTLAAYKCLDCGHSWEIDSSD